MLTHFSTVEHFNSERNFLSTRMITNEKVLFKAASNKNIDEIVKICFFKSCQRVELNKNEHEKTIYFLHLYPETKE